MIFEPLSREEASRSVAAIEAAIAAGALWPVPRGRKDRSAIAEAAMALGISRATMTQRIRRAHALYGMTPNGVAPIAAKTAAPVKEPTASDRHDAVFWRRRAAELERAVGAAERLAEHLAGLRDSPVEPPEWLWRADPGRRGRSVVGCLVSDIHMGERIDEDAMSGVNRFDPDICRARLRRYFEASIGVGRRWASDTECQGVLLALAGDLISGDIHEELRISNALTAHEQCQAVVESIIAGIRMLLEAYPAVHVVGVPGNHGRTTHKPTAKLYARLSYDILICDMVRQRFEGDKRVTWQFGRATDQVTPIFGRVVFTTHGDKIGTKGGMGFAGPNLPIVRGGFRVEAQQARLGRRPDLIQFGHYHTSSNPGLILANGSVPGVSEYGADLRAAIEPPQQWLYLLHDRWWLRERAAIQLEEPVEPPKPRVTIPARMVRQ